MPVTGFSFKRLKVDFKSKAFRGTKAAIRAAVVRAIATINKNIRKGGSWSKFIPEDTGTLIESGVARELGNMKGVNVTWGATYIPHLKERVKSGKAKLQKGTASIDWEHVILPLARDLIFRYIEEELKKRGIKTSIMGGTMSRGRYLGEAR